MSLDAQGVSARWRDFSGGSPRRSDVMETVVFCCRARSAPDSDRKTIRGRRCRLEGLLGDAFKDGSCGLTDGVEGFKEQFLVPSVKLDVVRAC